MLNSVEEYRQIEERYKQVLDEYKRLEQQYDKLLQQDPGKATELYAELARKRAESEELYQQLADFRTRLAETRLPAV
jgi:TRAP-type mannitol/chloroaromatic compound transport system substrate-binding protein